MLLYRVFRYSDTAKPGTSGHPLFLVRPQTTGRWDNTAHFDAWYLSRNAECAVGETFGDLNVWRDATFTHVFPGGTRSALGIFEAPDTLAVLDLDDAQNLLDRHLRPTQVAIRNRPATQDIALRVFNETRSGGARKWDGLSWWSTRWPQWNPICLWAPPGDTPPFTLKAAELLTPSHPAVVDAAQTLAKQIL